MRLIIVGLLLWHSGSSLVAQTAEIDIKKVLEPLQNATHLYFENQFLYFEGAASTPVETLDGVFHRDGKQEFVRMGQTEVLKIGAFIVATDHEDRVISAANEPPIGSLNSIVDAEKLNGLLETREAIVQYAPGNGGSLAISIVDPLNPSEKLIIYYDPFSWVIKEASLTTGDPFENPWEPSDKKITIVVRYLNYSTLTKTFPYKVENYVRKEGKQYVANGKCKGYRII